MKRLTAFLIALLLALTALPALAEASFETRTPRTELLDFTNVTSPVSNSSEGWSYEPTGSNGKPLLRLNGYGTASAHSAPIKLRRDSTIIVTGNCYIDNNCMGTATNVIESAPDGFLKIEGTGTLNLYAENYNGSCISIPTGGANDNSEFLYINDITVNCHGMMADNYNAATLKPCIYANHNCELHNATVNTHYGRGGIIVEGYSPLYGVNEENANVLLIENSTVNIQNSNNNNLWNFAEGIRIQFGKMRFVNSNITINAGANSIYSRLSLNIESGTVNVRSTPLSTYSPIIMCTNLIVGSGVQNLYFGTTRYTGTTIIRYDDSYLPAPCQCASNIVFDVGGFANDEFYAAPDPNNGGLPAIKLHRSGSSVHTVSFYGIDGELISTVYVEDGGAATAPAMAPYVTNASGCWVFCGWDTDFSNVTTDLTVHAVYRLLGDVDRNGVVNMTDALLVMRYSMHILDLDDEQLIIANVDGNSAVNMSDAVLIMRFSMHLINTFPIAGQ